MGQTVVVSDDVFMIVVSVGGEPHYAVNYTVTATLNTARQVVLPMSRICSFHQEVKRVIPRLVLPEPPKLGKRPKKRKKEQDVDEVVAYFRELVSSEVLRENIPMLVNILTMEFDVAQYEMRSWSGSPRSSSDPELSRVWANGEKEKRENFEALLDSLALDISAINEKDQFRLGMSCGSLSAMSDEISSPTSPGRSPKKDWKPKSFFSRKGKPKEKEKEKEVRERKPGGSRIGATESLSTLGTSGSLEVLPGSGSEYHVVDHVTVLSATHHIVRAKRPDDSTVLLKVLLSAAREKQRQMEDEAESMQTVAALDVAVPLIELVMGHQIHGARPYQMALVMEDVPGQLLYQEVYCAPERETVTSASLLSFMGSVAKVIAVLHGKGVVHAGIDPQSILIEQRDEADGAEAPPKLHLLSFANARSMFWTETKGAIEGNPQYSAPELMDPEGMYDFKADLFSLGITMLEYTLGHYPTAIVDRLPKVGGVVGHQDVVRAEDLPGIDARVVQVLNKLVQYDQKVRYQNVPSLLHDIDQLTADLGEPELQAFEPGQMDWAWQNLYSNTDFLWNVLPHISKEITQAAKRVAKTSSSEVIVFQNDFGPAVAEIVKNAMEKKVLARTPAFFLQIQIDDYAERPFQGLSFTGIAEQVLARKDKAVWIEAIREAVGVSGKSVCAIVPELEQILEPGNMAGHKMLHVEQFKLLFHKLCRAISHRNGAPLVLLINNFQSIEASSLHVLRYALAKSKNILLFANYMPSSETDTEKLSTFFSQKNLDLKVVKLTNLSEDQTSEFVYSILSFPRTDLQALCSAVFKVTSGNPLYIKALLQVLYSHHQLSFSFRQGKWQWDQNFLNRLPVVNLVEFMKFVIRRIPKKTLTVLSCASCMGNKFSLEILKSVLGTMHTEHICQRLDELVFMQFLTRTDEDTFVFPNSAYQQAAYEFLSASDQKQFHMNIGFALLKTLSSSKDERVFDICYQFERAGELLLADKNACLTMGKLNLDLSRSCLGLACADLGRKYAVRGLAAVEHNGDGWESHFSLTFDLKLCLAKSMRLLQNIPECDTLLDELMDNLKRSKSDDLSLRVATIYDQRVLCCLQAGDMRRGLECVAEALAYFDSSFILDPTEEDVQSGLTSVLRVVKQRYKGDLSRVAAVSPVKDYEQALLQRLLSKAVEMQYFLNPTGFVTTVLQSVLMTLVHGSCRYSLQAIADYALLHCGALQEFGQAEAWVEVVRQMRNNSPDLRAMAHNLCDTTTLLTELGHRPVAEVQVELQRLYRVAIENGHFPDAAYIAAWWSVLAFHGTTHLSKLEPVIKEFLGYAKQVVPVFAALSALRKLIATLQGTADYKPIGDESLSLPACRVVVGLQYLKMCCLMARYEDAHQVLLVSPTIIECKWTVVNTGASWAEFSYFLARTLMGILATQSDLTEEQTEAYQRELARHKAILAAGTFNRAKLLWAIVQGLQLLRDEQAREAIGIFSTAELYADESEAYGHRIAIHEGLARAWLLMGTAAADAKHKEHLRLAYALADDWGALIKSKALAEEFPSLKPWAAMRGRMTSEEECSFRDGKLFSEHISQLLHTEMVLGSLYKKILAEIMAYAGADKVFVVVADIPDSPTVECAGVGENWTIMNPKPLLSCETIDQEIVLRVIKGDEAILLSNACEEKNCSAYAKQNRTAAVLCLPVLILRKPVAYLYLESSMPDMFEDVDTSMLAWPLAHMIVQVENLMANRQAPRRETSAGEPDELVKASLDSIVLQGDLLYADRKTGSWERYFAVVRTNRLELYVSQDRSKPKRTLLFKQYTEIKPVKASFLHQKKGILPVDVQFPSDTVDPSQNVYFSLTGPQRKRSEYFVFEGKQRGRQWLDMIHRTINREEHPGNARMQSNITIDRKEIRLDSVLGRGGAAVVYKGKWNALDVAVKKLHGHVSESEVSSFLEEIGILKSLRHPNILLFLGGYSDEVGKPCIVTEFMCRGSLEDVLYDPLIRMTSEMKADALRQIAQGVLYLHSFQPPIIHRDLKPANILVSQNFGMKLGDFGLARTCSDTLMTGAQGTVKWMAPEVLENGFYSELADVYSFALIMWEVWTQKPFYTEIKFNARIEYKVIHERMRPEVPADCPKLYRELMEQCWQHDAQCRPSFPQIFKLLQDPALMA